MHQRKNFSYINASIDDIILHFQSSTSQAIHAARTAHPITTPVGAKIADAYYKFKLAQLESKLSR
jgi:hypothetical protein